MPTVRGKIAVLATALGGDARAVPRLSQEMGFDGLLFDAGWATLNLASLSETGRREVRHLLANSGQQLVGAKTHIGPEPIGPGADIDRLLAGAEKLLAALAALGAPLLCLDLGQLPEPPKPIKVAPAIPPGLAGMILIPTPSSAPAPAATSQTVATTADDPATASALASLLDELGRLADRYSVTLAMRSDLSSLAALSSALNAVRCPWFGVDIDPVAILRDDWELDDIFSSLGSLVRHVRARDALAGTDRRTRPTPIGEGSIDWPGLLHRLEESGYHGWLTIDPTELSDRRAAAAAGLAVLRKLQAGK